MDDDSDPLQNLPIPTTDQEKPYNNKIARYLSLTLSIPERTGRALSAIIGGGTMLLTKMLVPGAIKNTSSYHFTLGMFQTFLVQNVAGMTEMRTQTELQEKFVHRKLLGSSLEAAGLLTMHFSPVWVFAIASDTARGGQVFVQRLVQQLKENGVIDPQSNPQTIEQILLSIQDVSHRSAAAIDTPPLSKQEIQDLADELRISAARLTENSSQLLPRFESLWNQITLVARKENMNLAQILGMLSVRAAAVSNSGIGTADALGKTSYGILDEMVLTEYRETLKGISDEGASNYLFNHMQPFIENARSHFDFRNETSTQRWLLGFLGKFKAKLRPKN